MPIFTPTGEQDPFLHVHLRRGEEIYCESDAMVMMDNTLELRGKMQGGFMSALVRRLANGESFFQQHIRAERGGGDCLLAPMMPGGIEVLDIGKNQYNLNDGAYLAASERVQLTARMQSIGTALFAGTGGFFIGQTSGEGQIVINGFGSLFTLEVTPQSPVIIDNGHVVAWDSRLHYELSVTTGASRGMLGNLVNSVTSGEAVVLKFSGSGKVILCSRNANSFRSWAKQ